MQEDLDRVLLTEQQIEQRLATLANELRRAYADRDLTVVAVLTGGFLFAADLLKRLPLPLRLDYLGISSYRGATRSRGGLSVTRGLALDVAGRDVLVVDDILDSGRTLLKIREIIQALRPRSLKFCVLLEKAVAHASGVQADFVGFRIPNQFVVGYGLDYRERYRNLPCVATLKPAIIQRDGA